ncbi:MAG: hypothetical protein A3H45_02110 [Ignavibacteria bacterium RIFCSPLOWO2_02_FULL_55_14]|nr:MAG: hypothetical protein A2X68_00095 [Ignavibacteria bacterium GWC2_56_12]OGU67607.1 MAG: hypothetical protein A3C56_10885 [Ignavibacteria bacterium RIFCSPHIGHO2_02_FULL_56_12]OGU71924.1 MAG: hypothetical protein A3H45_02110 [Ignavibacteria bacterium RIFCSPLOWO2_02_FULL_55_14]
MNISKQAGIALMMIGIFATLDCSTSPRFTKGGEQTATSVSGEHSSTSARRTSSKALLTLEGVASYYADDFHGKQAANGETFDMNDLTAAHRTFPFGTRVRVTNLANGKVVVVRVNDRGPFKEGRIIDLSRGAARKIDLIQTGTTKVRLEVLQWGDGTLYHKK